MDVDSASTSKSLIRRVVQCDPSAWERFAQIYTPLILEWARLHGLQDADAADVTQEVFRGVTKGIAAFSPGGDGAPFRPWLWGITRRKIVDVFRRRAGQPTGAGGDEHYVRLQQLPTAPPEDADEQHKSRVVDGIARRALALMQTDFEPTTWRAF